MLFKEVRDLCKRYKEVQNELQKNQEILSKAYEEHNKFWEQLQSECDIKGHGKEFEEEKKSHSSYILCPNCLSKIKIGKIPRPCIVIEQSKSPSIYDKNTFGKWMEEEHKGWVVETITFEDAKKEVEDFFKEYESLTTLKLKVEALQKESKEIYQTLEKIWEITDETLEKYEDRVRRYSEYEHTIRNLRGMRRE